MGPGGRRGAGGPGAGAGARGAGAMEGVWELVGMVGEVLAHVAGGRVPPVPLLKACAARGLGYGLVGASSVIKLPQVLNVVRAGSAEGLAPSAFEAEAFVYTITCLYSLDRGLSFSNYGESALILVQSLALLGMLYRYSGAPLWRVAAFLCAYGGLLGAFFTGKLSHEAVDALFGANTVLYVASRVMQIWQNYRAGATGQLSSATFGANTVGSAVRVFTSVVEGAGAPMVRTFALGTALNAVILGQIVLYTRQRATAAAKKLQKKKKK